MFSTLIWILVAISAVGCAIGFKKFVWFLTAGYGFAVTGCGAALLGYAALTGSSNYASYVHSALIVLFGLRLGLFLIVREKKSNNVGTDNQVKPIPVPVAVVMWIVLAFLYAFETAPVAYSLINGGSASVLQWAGAAVSAIGVLIDLVAEKQKSAARTADERAPVMNGLYRIVRCPNYLGELLVWVGVLLSGIGGVQGVQWVIVLVGFVAILGIIFSGAKRVCVRQNKIYRGIPEFRTYTEKTPVLLPLLPWHITERKEK